MAGREPQYSIEARSLSIVGGTASHDFWVLRDQNGNAVAELHGLATDRESGRYVPIGTDEQRHSLRVWHFVHDEEYANQLGVGRTSASYIQDGQQSRTVLTAGREEVMARWNAAVAAKEPLNALDLNYPSYGFRIFGDTVNSNSTYRTLGEVMGVPVREFPGVLEPGVDNRMTSPEQIERWRNPNYPVIDEPSVREGNGYRRLSQAEPVPETVARYAAAEQAIERLGPQDRQLYEKATRALQERGGYSDEQVRNIATAGVLAFKNDPTVREPQDVAIHGDRLYVGYFPHGRDREPVFQANVKLEEAARIPAEQSHQGVEALSRQTTLAQHHPQDLQQSETPARGARA
jgi:hypothetical protein